VTLDSLANAGKDRTYGFEANATLKPFRWWNMIVNGSIFHYRFFSSYEGCTDNSVLSYAASMINSFTLGKTTRMQFDANVVGPQLRTQGREEAYCYFSLALRQQILRNRLSASIVAHDIFRTARYDNHLISPTLISTTHVRPKYPNIVLSLTYSFNAEGQHKDKGGAVSSGAFFEGKDF
jgi:hypothetical protein